MEYGFVRCGELSAKKDEAEKSKVWVCSKPGYVSVCSVEPRGKGRGRKGGRGRGQQRLARGTGSLRKLLACEGEREEAAVLCTTCMQASVCNVFAG
jgi:hypothetical protein